MAAVADHMGDQLGSIAYFDSYPADMAVLGELSDNEIFLGHRGRYYFDVTVLGKSAHTCHKPLAVNANALAAHAILELEASHFTPELRTGCVTCSARRRSWSRAGSTAACRPAGRR